MPRCGARRVYVDYSSPDEWTLTRILPSPPHDATFGWTHITKCDFSIEHWGGFCHGKCLTETALCQSVAS